MSFQPVLSAQEVEAAFGGQFVGLTPLSSGGQAQVFTAQPSGGGTLVALKVYFPGQLEERTQREVQALRTLAGETLVKLRDSGTCSLRGLTCVYVATDLVDGTPLETKVAAGPMTVRSMLQVGHDVAAALDLLWSRRIVHRDVKPANVILTPAGRAVLIDLGVARHLSMSSLTTAGKTWGTEGYMSPEQMRTLRRLSCKSDVFALGVMLLECLIGAHPTGRQQIALANGGPKCATLQPSLTADVATLIDGMLTKNPVRRPVPAFVVKQCALLLPRV